MTVRISFILFFSFAVVIFPFRDSECSSKFSVDTAERAFYSKPDQIIKQFDRESSDCQKNIILAKAYKGKKKLKNSILYYANSCFEKNFNFKIRLFAQPVYSFVQSDNGRSIFYNESIYQIASIFFDYAEHEYVIKFTELLENDKSALYRDAVLLKSRSFQKLNRFNPAIECLRKIASDYKDSESLSLIYLRLGSVFESAGDFTNAADSYVTVIKCDSDIWQNRIASKRLIYITAEKKIKLDSSEKNRLFTSALYDAGQYNKALTLAETILQKERSPEMELIKLKILTLKNYPKAVSFLKSKEGKTDYDKLLLAHANVLWGKGKKKEAVEIYDRLISTPDNQILERILTRLSFYYEERNRPELLKYIELYIKNFPSNVQSGRLIWLAGRYYIRANNNEKASEYFKQGIQQYPDNIYTSYCRFWLNKINISEKKTVPSDDLELLDDLALNNPDTYHALSLLKSKADKTDTSLLNKQFKEALKNKNKNRALLVHTLLFIKNGYNKSHSERLKQLDNGITFHYIKAADLIKNPSYSPRYKNLFKNLETYFYAGNPEGINREMMLIPENDEEGQKELSLALTVFSDKFRYYNYSTVYGFKLLKYLKIKENIALLPQKYAEALYPYAFPGCVNDESKKFKIKPELLLSIMKVESNFNHKAISPAKAAGLMQLMRPTAKGIAKNIGVTGYDLLNPCTSIRFGSSYIAWLNGYYNGEIEYMIAGYNAGAGNVNKWKKYKINLDIDYFSEFNPYDETRDYIFRTKKYMIQYESIYKNLKE